MLNWRHGYRYFPHRRSRQGCAALTAEIDDLVGIAARAPSPYVTKSLEKRFDKLARKKSPDDARKLREMTAQLDKIIIQLNGRPLSQLQTMVMCAIFACLFAGITIFAEGGASNIHEFGKIEIYLYMIGGPVFGVMTIAARNVLPLNAALLTLALAAGGLYHAYTLIMGHSQTELILYGYAGGLGLAVISSLIALTRDATKRI